MTRAAAATRIVTVAHDTVFDAVREATVSVRLCSPYLSGGVAEALAKVAARSAADWRVMVRLDPAAGAYGAMSLPGVRSLMEAGVTVRNARRFHAKAMVADGRTGFAGSGNLTAAGLSTHPRSNWEIGVPLDPEQTLEAVGVFDLWWASSTDVTDSVLDRVAATAAGFPVTIPPRAIESASYTADRETADELIARSGHVTTWIKSMHMDAVEADVPWGADPHIADPPRQKTQQPYGYPHYEVGDLVLVYVKHARVCNAVVEVTKVAELDDTRLVAARIPADDVLRWPWVTLVARVLQVPATAGMPLAHIGIAGGSIQSGHRRIPRTSFVAALAYLLDATPD